MVALSCDLSGMRDAHANRKAQRRRREQGRKRPPSDPAKSDDGGCMCYHCADEFKPQP
jgi:hypothetical protein